ncbi:MAG: FHA domain-containing protein [Planctomycetes bacterium]|nr:FHA domain-containing protein [Planctomycetota bacterium]
MTEPSPLLALRLRGRDHALEVGRTYRLGADPACDFALRSAGAARVHAEIEVRTDGVWLRDLGSSSGSRRNGERVGEVRLAAADVLQFDADVATVVVDAGHAELVPVPALRLLAVARRSTALRSAARPDRREAATFQALVALELRRAPWLGLSLLLHAVLLLLLVWFWQVEPPRGRQLALHRVLPSWTPPQPTVAELAPELPVVTEPVVEAPTEVVPPPPPPTAEAEPAPQPAETPPSAAEAERVVAEGAVAGGAAVEPRAVRPRPVRTGSAPVVGSPQFQRTVAELRRTGLEIVFVCDSTGSMGATLQAAKDTMALMLGVLRRLVPDARFGIVTYRDHGKSEEYVTRQLPLGSDVWRAVNFVNGIAANGGGDQPEAVRDGLDAAFAQAWRPGTRRVVVLVGDAPPHERDRAALTTAIRRFARSPECRVHALVASPALAGKDTRESFAAIAKSGRGECLPLEDAAVVLRLVLALAFGREFTADLSAVVDQVAANQLQTATWALDLARRGGPELADELQQTPVPDELVHALARLPKLTVSLQLVDLLADPALPAGSRHALAWVLQRQLGLFELPFDPAAEGPPPPRVLERLRGMVQRTLK